MSIVGCDVRRGLMKDFFRVIREKLPENSW
jgi:hypothetical protein